MPFPTVSVVIPAYNQAQFLGEAIQSVLNQTYTDFEVIVVNDASPDDTEMVVRQFDDPRIKYVVHERNRGLPAARNTGTRAAQGELIALLDADDIFHPDKLRLHVDFLAEHPEIGASYNSRFELNHSAQTIRELVRPPEYVSLADFVLGYPFTPSDTVVRRHWLFDVDMQNEDFGTAADDLDLKVRLSLGGCKFSRVDRALNYRRHHSGRIRKGLDTWLAEVLYLLETIFSDPRCPAEVLPLREMALAANYLVYGLYALSYGDTQLGRAYVQEAAQLDASLLEGRPNNLLKNVLRFAIADDSLSHQALLQQFFAQLPPAMIGAESEQEWAVAQGYLLRGVRAVVWDRAADGRAHFAKACELNATVDEPFMLELAYQLFSYELEFGAEAAMAVFQQLSSHIEDLAGARSVRRIKSLYLLDRAFHYFGSEKQHIVPAVIVRALANDPKHLSNRGVWSILLHTTVFK